jgi:hypothetical protein
MTDRRKTSRILLAASAMIAIALLWQFYSPYKICVRHATTEAVRSGMPSESATAYAEGLCTSKLPLRN